ncbi:MAG: response regulator [Rhodocyclaceae bacterium]|nr:response regulator [Rhodocyclaceae bacterium]
MKKTGRLLIVDDEEAALRNIERAMGKEGYEVVTAGSGPAALALLERQQFDILLTDLRMEKVDGMQLLKACREKHPDTEVIMITGYATAEAAVQAMKRGAFYFVAKPFRLSEVRKVVDQAMEKVRLRTENTQLRQQVDAFRGKVSIITQDPAMKRLLELARQVAPTDCNVLIVGDSGTGKELFARYLHHHSGRADGPYIAVNCGAFSQELLANELFGHEKEAFTGAASSRKGLIEAASGGTLFLDEITEMAADMQVKLLRVIQEKEVLRLGATSPVKVDIRIIAATNRDLAEAIKSGGLRQDLYFRLNVVTLKIPPLAQRKGDIPLLVRHFLQKYSVQMRKTVTATSQAVDEILMNYDYPGNVRELENLIERGTAVTTGETIESAHLPDDLRQQTAFLCQKNTRIETLDEQERKYIRWVLDEVGGNQTAAAQMLGIDRSSLWRKLKAYQIDGK